MKELRLTNIRSLRYLGRVGKVKEHLRVSTKIAPRRAYRFANFNHSSQYIMIRDLALAAKASCSAEDQESLIPIVLQLKKISELVAKQGILALENELPHIKDRFLNLGVQLIIDRVETENIKDILDSDIYYNQSNGRELLKKIIIREGLLRIQAGDTPRNVLICTKIFLGRVDETTFRAHAQG